MIRTVWQGEMADRMAALNRAHQPLEINNADLDTLQGVEGLGQVLGQRVVNARSNHGRFTDWYELIRRVRGMSAKLARRLSDSGLRVNGEPFESKLDSNSHTA